MMLRRAAVKLLGALTLLAGVGLSESASATETIKLGTLMVLAVGVMATLVKLL